MKIMSNVEALHALNKGYLYNNDFGFIKNINIQKEVRKSGFKLTHKQRSWLKTIMWRIENNKKVDNKEQLAKDFNLGKMRLIVNREVQMNDNNQEGEVIDDVERVF